jgi:hypothetical protein
LIKKNADSHQCNSEFPLKRHPHDSGLDRSQIGVKGSYWQDKTMAISMTTTCLVMVFARLPVVVRPFNSRIVDFDQSQFVWIVGKQIAYSLLPLIRFGGLNHD